MEKTISPEERIRRAEEIYARRTASNSIRMSSKQVKDGKEKKQFSLYRKLIIQVLICILIYLVFTLIKDANYIFSEDVLNKTKEFLNTDINFEVVSGRVGQFFEDNKGKLDFLGEWLKNDDKQNDNVENQNNSTESQSNSEENQNTQKGEENKNSTSTNEQSNQSSESKNTEQGNENKDGNTENGKTNNENNTSIGIGGASSNEVAVSTSSNSNNGKTQMEIDAEYIKKNFNIGLPAKGKITSGYGKREETEIVSANHFGIDIGVNTGTAVVAAMDGKVSLVSDEGEYGTHVKIVNKDITTIYAHCSKILVKKGDNVKKGQKIALSGNTGRTTGPHLHFEIRRDNRTVDPELCVENS